MVLKCELVEEMKGKRKKFIWRRREAKAKENGNERVDRKIEKMKAKMNGTVEEKIMKKVKK